MQLRVTLTILISVFGSMAVASCARGNPTQPSPLVSADVLIRALEQLGAAVARLGEMPRDSHPYFSVNALRLAVDGADVYVWDYENVAAAQRDALKVSRDGFTIGTTSISWIAAPRFDRKDRLIVLYVGTDGNTIRRLDTVLGAPFAGR